MFCSNTLQIGNRWILSSADCIGENLVISDIFVTVNVYNKDSDTLEEVPVISVTKHAQYRETYNYVKRSSRYDFALLQLEEVRQFVSAFFYVTAVSVMGIFAATHIQQRSQTRLSAEVTGTTGLGSLIICS